jgi:hypothetical protein
VVRLMICARSSEDYPAGVLDKKERRWALALLAESAGQLRWSMRVWGRVVVSDGNATGEEETARLLRHSGGGALFIACDVAHTEQCRTFVEWTAAPWADAPYATTQVGGDAAPTTNTRSRRGSE